MKLIRTNTAALHLSWAARTTSPRALHSLLGNVLIAADTAKIADEDVLVDTVGDRTTLSFTTDCDVPRKPTMTAWNPKQLDEAKIEFLATKTVTLNYALHGATTAADLLAALDQIKGELGGEISVDPHNIVLGHTDGGVTTMSFSISETVPGIEMDTLSTSRLAALPKSHTGLDTDPLFNPEAGSLVGPEEPICAKPVTKKASKAAPTPVAEVKTAEQALKVETLAEAAVTPEQLVPEPVPEPVDVAPVVELVPEPVAEPVTVEAEPEPEPAGPTPSATVLTVVPMPVSTSDFDVTEPPDEWDSQPPEDDAPEPATPEAPDMPEFDVAALREPPVESSGRRPSSNGSAAPASSPCPARTKSFAPSAIVTGPNGKIVLNESDIF